MQKSIRILSNPYFFFKIAALILCFPVSGARADDSNKIFRIEGEFLSARLNSEKATSQVIAKFRGNFAIISSPTDSKVLYATELDGEVGFSFPGEHAVFLSTATAAQGIEMNSPIDMVTLLPSFRNSKMVITF